MWMNLTGSFYLKQSVRQHDEVVLSVRTGDPKRAILERRPERGWCGRRALGPEHRINRELLRGFRAFDGKMALVGPLARNVTTARFAGGVFRVNGNGKLVRHAAVPRDSRRNQLGRQRGPVATNERNIVRAIPGKILFGMQQPGKLSRCGE